MEDARFDGLTSGERTVLRLAATGATSKEIAQETQLSPSTVDTYLKHACRKLGITGRRQAGLALMHHEGTVSQRLGYQSAAVADRPDLDQPFGQALTAAGDREDRGGLVLREDRSLFEAPVTFKPWWHPSRWGGDVELSLPEVAKSILFLMLGIAIAWYLVVHGAALLPDIYLG